MNYSLSGRRIDIQLRGAVLPGCEENWSGVLVSLEDVSERESARRLLALSENYARGLFQHSPISLWVEEAMEAIANLVALNNQFYSGHPLSLAMGAAPSRPGERLEAVGRRADAAMYAAKRAHYDDAPNDCRSTASSP